MTQISGIAMTQISGDPRMRARGGEGKESFVS